MILGYLPNNEPIDNTFAQEVMTQDRDVTREEFIALRNAVDARFQIFPERNCTYREYKEYDERRHREAAWFMTYMETMWQINAPQGWGNERYNQRTLNRLAIAQLRMLGFVPEDDEEEGEE